MTLDAFFPTPGRVLTVAIGQMPLSHSVWGPPLWDTVMSMCPHCDLADSRGGLDGGSQGRKAQESQASHLEMSSRSSTEWAQCWPGQPEHI